MMTVMGLCKLAADKCSMHIAHSFGNFAQAYHTNVFKFMVRTHNKDVVHNDGPTANSGLI